MKTTTRRSFLKACAAAGVTGTLGWEGCVSLPDEGAVYSGWKPGELDLHFVYTGCGENMFYRLPDGTSILNDTGDFYRPEDHQYPARGTYGTQDSSMNLLGPWVATFDRRA